MTSPSRTPRTDAASAHLPGCGVWEGTHTGSCDCAESGLVAADFARQLETELAQAREEALEDAAKVAKESSFVDGKNGTIEGQIAAAIRALKGKPDAARKEAK